MFDAVRNKVKSLAQKARQVLGSPKIWGTVAVFSPTLVACYGMPYDDYEFYDGIDVYQEADCIDGYVRLMHGQNGDIYGSELKISRECSITETRIGCSESDTSEDMICRLLATDEYAEAVGYADCRTETFEQYSDGCTELGKCEEDCTETSTKPCNPVCNGNRLLTWRSGKWNGLWKSFFLECEGECVQEEHFAWCRYKKTESENSPSE